MPDNEQPKNVGTAQTITRIDWVEPPPFFEVYANQAQPAITTFDVTINFGTFVEVEGGIAKVAKRASILMAPEVAKLLVLQLASGLAQFEQNVRPIPLHGQLVPPSLTQPPPVAPDSSE